MDLGELLFMARLKRPETIWVEGVEYPLGLLKMARTACYKGAPKHIYVIAHGSGPSAMTKVGIANSVSARLEQIQASSPVPVRLCNHWEVPDYAAVWIERAVHEMLRHKHSHAEWFRCDPWLATSAIAKSLPFLGGCKQWWVGTLRDSQAWKTVVAEFVKDPPTTPTDTN